MEATTTTPTYHKILSPLLAGLVTGLGFHRIASRFLMPWLPPPLILVTAILILLACFVYIFIWLRQEHRVPDSTQSRFGFFQGLIRYAIAIDLSFFGWQKIFGLQFFVPMGMLDEPFSSLSGEWLMWAFFKHSYPMIVSIALTQLLGAMLLLFGRTKLIGIFVLLPVLVNILLLDIFYGLPPGVIVHAIALLSALIYILLTEYDKLAEIFLSAKKLLPSAPLRPLTKAMARIMLVILPLLFIASAKLRTPVSSLNGKYQVEKITVNSADRSSLIGRDSVLSTVYLDIGNDCVFQFRDHRQRLYGTFNFDEPSRQLHINWHYPPSFKDELSATLEPAGDKRLRLSGKMGENEITATLIKVK